MTQAQAPRKRRKRCALRFTPILRTLFTQRLRMPREIPRPPMASAESKMLP